MGSEHAPATGRHTDRLRSPGHAPGARGRPASATIDDGFDPYDDIDEWDETAAPGGQPRILWGRIAFFGVALLVAFVLGRATAGGDEEALATAQARIDELTTELEQARAEVDALEAGGTGGEEAAAPAEGDDAASSTGEAAGEADEAAAEGGQEEAEDPDAGGDEGAAAAEGDSAPETDEDGSAATTYTVQPGDYLFGLAERFYGNGRLWRQISEANGLGPGAVLSPGQTLTIPPAP